MTNTTISSGVNDFSGTEIVLQKIPLEQIYLQLESSSEKSSRIISESSTLHLHVQCSALMQ